MNLDNYKLATPDEGISFNQLELKAKIEKAEDLINERIADKYVLLHEDMPKGWTTEDYLDMLDNITWHTRLIERLKIIHANYLIDYETYEA